MQKKAGDMPDGQSKKETHCRRIGVAGRKSKPEAVIARRAAMWCPMHSGVMDGRTSFAMTAASGKTNRALKSQ
jgi:hypothetical protein